jgi:calcium-dependent protein kinase
MRAHFVQDGVQHFVFDYCSRGDLLDVVSAAGYLPNQVALRYFRQILSGVCFMHRRLVAHRDLSLENILVDNHNIARVCDFGLAVTLPNRCTDSVGKQMYMAPEVVLGHAYDPVKADVWCLGIMLFRMLTGFPPLDIAHIVDRKFCILREHGVSALVHSWNKTSMFQPKALNLLDRMLHPIPRLRLTMLDVLRHPYVCGF